MSVKQDQRVNLQDWEFIFQDGWCLASFVVTPNRRIKLAPVNFSSLLCHLINCVNLLKFVFCALLSGIPTIFACNCSTTISYDNVAYCASPCSYYLALFFTVRLKSQQFSSISCSWLCVESKVPERTTVLHNAVHIHVFLAPAPAEDGAKTDI